jgi:hypothetical protein
MSLKFRRLIALKLLKLVRPTLTTKLLLSLHLCMHRLVFIEHLSVHVSRPGYTIGCDLIILAKLVRNTNLQPLHYNGHILLELNYCS